MGILDLTLSDSFTEILFPLILSISPISVILLLFLIPMLFYFILTDHSVQKAYKLVEICKHKLTISTPSLTILLFFVYIIIFLSLLYIKKTTNFCIVFF